MLNSNFKITGLNEARNLLKVLPDRTQKRVLNGAVRAGATVLRKEIKAAAPVDADKRSPASEKYGRLKDNIRVLRLKFGVPKTSAMYRVDTGRAFWGYFLEFGTRFIAARAWFRPAVDANFDRAVNQMKERLASGIEREAEKLVKVGK
jgi:HK97 gp10 family phage protein